MTEYYISIRHYSDLHEKLPDRDWKLFASESEIDAGEKFCVQIFYKGILDSDITGSDIYALWEELQDEDIRGCINGYKISKNNENIIIKE